MQTMNHSLRGKRLSQAGFTLIELMIAMLLGLLVAAAAGAVFISNKRVYGSTETLNRIQETGRIAFELMSRDLREAGGSPCSTGASLVNQMVDGDNTYWTQFADGIRGYGGTAAMPGTTAGTAVAQRVAGTDAVEMHLTERGDIRVVGHSTPSANIDVSSVAGIAEDDILLICNMSFAFIFQATGISTSALNLQHNGGGGQSLNCSQEFQHVRDCSPGASGGNGYCFQVGSGAVNPNCSRFSNSPAYVARIQSLRWYIGNNARGGRSLYRAIVRNNSGTNTPNVVLPEEIAEGVRDMDLTYLVAGANDYVAAASVTDWRRVTAVRVELVIEGTEGALEGSYIEGTDGAVLDRTVTNVVALRNRESLL
jgi:type IV pilus assembly protein PilW